MYFQVIVSAFNVCKPTIRDDKINQFSSEIEPDDRVDRSEIKFKGKCGREELQRELKTWLQKPIEIQLKRKLGREKLQGELETWIQKPVELKQLKRKYRAELKGVSEIELEGEYAIKQRQPSVEFNGEYEQGKCFGLPGKMLHPKHWV